MARAFKKGVCVQRTWSFMTSGCNCVDLSPEPIRHTADRILNIFGGRYFGGLYIGFPRFMETTKQRDYAVCPHAIPWKPWKRVPIWEGCEMLDSHEPFS